jgi:PIN domain nuclease of toxin-antitoxin system
LGNPDRRDAGKLWTSLDPDTIVVNIRSQEAWRILSLDVAHLHSLNALDSFTDHTDPFDRLLIAQAMNEDLKIITADSQFSRYGIDVIW